MKKIFIVVVVSLVFLLLGSMFASMKADRRAQFIDARQALKEAHIEPQKYGNFTNQFLKVYPYTNQLTIGGTRYQCEFAVDSEWFTGIGFIRPPNDKLGFLTITTNEIYIWVDKKRGLIPLGKSVLFPLGF